MDPHAVPPRPAEPAPAPTPEPAAEVGPDGRQVVLDEASGQPESIGEQLMEAEAELELERGRAGS